MKDLNRTVLDNGNFVFSYSPFDNTSVFNASLLGARLLSRIYSYTKEEELIETARKAIAYCCDYQNEDGSWYYSTLPFHQWIDNFHTGFNLECIIDYRRFSGDHSFDTHIEKGMKYYLNTFFDSEGRSAYYNNSLYPIDIHAPSQLFVTLHKAGNFEENNELADRVLAWTIRNMQSPEGYFYYQKKRFITNKISYMRWSQAWIFYGLTYYILDQDRSEKSKLKTETALHF
jgi:rhamnogalacturonyl hydrolase YesR